MPEDCFFFVYSEEDTSEEEEMRVMCVVCRNKSYPNLGWFWQGSIDGYGPWEYKCNVCDCIIHTPDDEKKEDKDNIVHTPDDEKKEDKL